MPRRVYAISALLAVMVGLNALLLLIAIVAVQEDWDATPVAPTNPILLLVIAYLTSQVSFLALWGALGDTRWFIRLSVVVAGVVLSLDLLTGWVRPEQRIADAFLAALGIQAYCLGGALIVRRFLGFSLHRTTPGDATRRTQSHRLQFSIPQLLACTGAIAILLALGRALLTHLTLQWEGYDAGEFVSYMILGAGFAVIAMVDIWLVLGNARRLAVAAASISLAAIVGGALDILLRERLMQSTLLPEGYLGSLWLEDLVGPRWGPLATIVAICCLYSAALGSALAVFRTIGYRYVWRPTHSAAALGRVLFDTLVGRPLWRHRSQRLADSRRLAVGAITGFTYRLAAGSIAPDILGMYTGQLIAPGVGTILGLICGAVCKPPRETDSS